MDKQKMSHIETLLDIVGAEAVSLVPAIAEYRTLPDSVERYKKAKLAVSMISAYATLRRSAGEV